MTGEPVLSVEGVAKKFCPGVRRSLVYGLLDILAEFVPFRRPDTGLRKGEFWALGGVDLQLHRGEAIAVLGHNGAGKSTLLKILSGLLPIERGEVRLDGKVVALIELGAGLNPLLTGRENIQLVARLHGLTRREAAALVPAALSFAELEENADDPIQTYSTGMKARLAFAIAANLPAHILLVDEVLAVGDIPFQRKCIAHMQRFLAGGGALLLVSHAINHVYAVCQRGILLENGRISHSGDVQEVVRAYLSSNAERGAQDASPAEGAVIAVDTVRIVEPGGQVAATRRPAELTIGYRAMEAVDAYIGFQLTTADGFTCIAASVDLVPRHIRTGTGTMTCEIANLPLAPGTYRVRPVIYDAVANVALPLAGQAGNGVELEVEGPLDMRTNAGMLQGQLVDLDLAWRRNPGDESSIQPLHIQERASSSS